MNLSRRDIGFFAFVVVALLVVLFGLGRLPLPFAASSAAQPFSQATAASTDNVIVRENALLGTLDWRIPAGRAATTQIQAYASATSVLPGHTLTFFVSTQTEGFSYSIGIYRLGWYGGLGGRLMVIQSNQTGHAHGYYDLVKQNLVNCDSCHVDVQLGLVEANWHPSYTLTVPTDWTTGIYLAKFVDANGMQTYVPFDVRGSSQSTYVAVTPDATYQAYNTWGGYSLYEAPGSAQTSSAEESSLTRAAKVSLDRPYDTANGSAQVLYGEADAIRWLERQGYDLSYMSDVDLHENPAELLHHSAYISLGHDEYWTKEMRDAVEHARDDGVSLAFLGANDVYWQIRFEPDSVGSADRTIVCYKVLTGHNDLARDPLYGKDDSRVTSQWRDPVLERPENALIGIMYSHLTLQKPPSFRWQVNPLAKSALLDGTGLQSGQSYGCGIVGNEWDRVFDNGATPVGLQLIGTSPTIANDGTNDFSNTTYYIAQSGAMVFAVGSIYWTLSLDSYRFGTDNPCAANSLVVPGMQKLLANVMDALVVHHSQGRL